MKHNIPSERRRCRGLAKTLMVCGSKQAEIRLSGQCERGLSARFASILADRESPIFHVRRASCLVSEKKACGYEGGEKETAARPHCRLPRLAPVRTVGGESTDHGPDGGSGNGESLRQMSAEALGGLYALSCTSGADAGPTTDIRFRGLILNRWAGQRWGATRRAGLDARWQDGPPALSMPTLGGPLSRFHSMPILGLWLWRCVRTHVVRLLLSLLPTTPSQRLFHRLLRYFCWDPNSTLPKSIRAVRSYIQSRSCSPAKQGSAVRSGEITL